MDILLFIILIVFSYATGTIIEHNHYESIKKREVLYKKLMTTSIKEIPVSNDEILSSKLVCGSCVISIDFFKKFTANLINLFGGKVVVYESLLDRARREAILRMKKQARMADMIVNVKIETSSISNQNNSKDDDNVGSVEVLAYGTAVQLK